MILTDKERNHIAGSIARVDANTSCKIVCRLTDKTFYYPIPAFFLAAAIALILTGFILLIGIDLGTITHRGWSAGTHGHRVAASMTDHRLRTTYLLTFVLLILAYPVTLMPQMSRLLTPLRLKQRRVQLAAIARFRVEQQLENADGLSVLIFVAAKDRLAVIVAGPRVQSKLPAGVWNEPTAALNAALKTGKMASGLMEAIEAMGAILAVPFPKPAELTSIVHDPRNSLDNVREI